MLGFFMIFFIFLVMSTKISFLCDFIENHKKKGKLEVGFNYLQPLQEKYLPKKRDFA